MPIYQSGNQLSDDPTKLPGNPTQLPRGEPVGQGAGGILLNLRRWQTNCPRSCASGVAGFQHQLIFQLG